MLVGLVVLADRQQEVVLDVGERRPQEWISRVFDAIRDPGLEVQELPLARENGERDCEVVVVPVGEGNEALLDDLRDVEHSAEVERVFLLALALVELADAGDDQVLVGLPQALQQPDVVGVVVQVGGENLRENFVEHGLPARRLYLSQRLDQQLGVLAHRHLEQLTNLQVVVVRDLDQQLHEVQVAPQLLRQNTAVLHRLLDLAVGQFEEAEHFWVLAAVDLQEEAGLRLRVVPSLEENLLWQFELVVCVLAHALQRTHEGEEGVFGAEFQFGAVDLQIHVLPLEVGHRLHAVTDEIVDVPPARAAFFPRPHLGTVDALQLLSLQVLLACHQQVSHEFLHAGVDRVALLRHHQQTLEGLVLCYGSQFAENQLESFGRAGGGRSEVAEQIAFSDSDGRRLFVEWWIVGEELPLIVEVVVQAHCRHALPLLRTGRQQVLVLLLQSLLQSAVLTDLEKDLVKHAVRQLGSPLV